MSLVPRAHRPQCAALMIGEFFVGIAMLRADHATDSRMAAGLAIRFHLDAMSQALRDIPSGGK